MYSPGFSGHCLLWLWPLNFWLQNLTVASLNPNTAVAKIGWNSLNWFLRYGVHKVFGMHRLTDSLTDSRTGTSENSMPPASKVFGDVGIKTKQRRWEAKRQTDWETNKEPCWHEYSVLPHDAAMLARSWKS